MALNTNPFIEGINPTATFGGYASVLLQLIRQAIPSSTYGMILFDTTAPDVTGSNAWRKTCVWLDLTLPDFPTVNVYKEGTSPGWVNTNNIIANNTITTAMIVNGAVTLPKLSVSGGTALQLIRVNATTTAFEFVSLASLVTVGSILPSAISGIAVAPGTFRVLANLNGGTTTWYHPDQVVQGVSNAVIDIDQIAPSPVTSARSRFITTRTADATATWRYFDPNVDILAAAMNGNRLTDFTVSVSKISPGAATEGSYLRIVGGVPDWDPAPLRTYKYTAQVAIPAAGVDIDVITYAATGGKADIYQFHFVCMAPDLGFALNDEVPLGSWGSQNATDEASPLIWFDASTSKVIHTGPQYYQLQALTGTRYDIFDITRASWNLKVTAIRFA